MTMKADKYRFVFEASGEECDACEEYPCICETTRYERDVIRGLVAAEARIRELEAEVERLRGDNARLTREVAMVAPSKLMLADSEEG